MASISAFPFLCFGDKIFKEDKITSKQNCVSYSMKRKQKGKIRRRQFISEPLNFRLRNAVGHRFQKKNILKIKKKIKWNKKQNEKTFLFYWGCFKRNNKKKKRKRRRKMNVCTVCGKVGTFQCSSCKSVYYCSRDHQKQVFSPTHTPKYFSSFFSSLLIRFSAILSAVPFPLSFYNYFFNIRKFYFIFSQ